MKKRNLKGLSLNKKQISKIDNVSGGRPPYQPSDLCPTEGCIEEPGPTPETSPHSVCNCGSDFATTCGSAIGHC